MRVSDGGADAGEVDRHRARRREVLLPGEGAHAFVEAVGIRCVHFRERQEHATGQSRPETGTIGGFETTDEVASRPCLLHPGGAQGAEFGGEQRLETLGRGSEETQRAGGCGAFRDL